MIQDIAPEQFSLAYSPAAPQADSPVFIFRGKSFLADVSGGELILPRFGELSLRRSDCIFLFSISGQAYFYCRRGISSKGGAFRFLSLRRALSMPPQSVAFAAMTACHLALWYHENRFCGVCGKPNRPDARERALRCPKCGAVRYPRINPTVIVAVLDGERMLITKYAPSHAPTTFFALIAGFCEIGESAEDTVRREVMEEVGLRVKNIRYYGSQPWGIDGNLSLGYVAELDGSPEIHMDQDELSQAVWVTRKETPLRKNTMALTAEMMEAFHLGKI